MENHKSIFDGSFEPSTTKPFAIWCRASAPTAAQLESTFKGVTLIECPLDEDFSTARAVLRALLLHGIGANYYGIWVDAAALTVQHLHRMAVDTLLDSDHAYGIDTFGEYGEPTVIGYVKP